MINLIDEIHQITLEKFLRNHIEKGRRIFTLVASKSLLSDRKIRFFIYTANSNDPPVDYMVDGNMIRQIENGGTMVPVNESFELICDNCDGKITSRKQIQIDVYQNIFCSDECKSAYTNDPNEEALRKIENGVEELENSLNKVEEDTDPK